MSKYVDDVIEKVEAKNHSEPTFIQAVNEVYSLSLIHISEPTRRM